MDFSHADLSGADLSKADLRNANFSGARLIGADLTGAYLLKTNFTNADLTDATVEPMTPPGSSEGGPLALLGGATLVGTTLRGSYLSSLDFTGARLQNVRLDPKSYFLWARGLTLESLASALGVPPEGIANAIAQRGLTPVSPETVEARLANVCGGAADSGASPVSGDFHPLTFELTWSYDRPSDFSPAPLRAWNPPAVQLSQYVACVTSDRVQLEQCRYQSVNPYGSGSTATLTRYRQDVRLRVVETTTLKVLAEQTLTGPDAPACPAQAGFSGSGAVSYGAWPLDAVLSATRPLVGAPRG